MSRQDPTVTIESITPEIAREYLQHNYGNRRLRPRLVAMFAREIKMGRWRMNGQGIIFAQSGRLFDGQHRLEAVILAGMPVRMSVTRGADDDSFATIDQGAKRTAGDDLRALGVANALAIAAGARLILAWQSGGNPRNAQISKTEIADFVLKHNIDLQRAYTETYQTRVAVPTSAMIAIHMMATESNDPDILRKMHVFVRGLVTGADLRADSPILVLRNTNQHLKRGVTMSSTGWFGLSAQAWNAFARGERRKAFKDVEWPEEVVGYSIKRGMPDTLDAEARNLIKTPLAAGGGKVPEDAAQEAAPPAPAPAAVRAKPRARRAAGAEA
jgi:hypothetical protein